VDDLRKCLAYLDVQDARIGLADFESSHPGLDPRRIWPPYMVYFWAPALVVKRAKVRAMISVVAAPLP
jgi:hypothetical protein